MEELKIEMKKLGVSQKELSQALSLNRSYVNQILNGKRVAPEWFEEKSVLALILIATANLEASKARTRVLGR